MLINHEEVSRLNNLLEFGMWDNELIESLFTSLENSPEKLLPEALPQLNTTSYLLYTVGRSTFAKRIALNILDWLKIYSKDKETLNVCIQNVQYLFQKEGIELTKDEVLNFDKTKILHGESWTTRFHKSDGIESGIYTAVSPKLPLTKFKGWLKSLNSDVLNDTGRIILKKVFSRFNQFPNAEEYVKNEEFLISLGIKQTDYERQNLFNIKDSILKKIPVDLTLHRRFSGGDGLLPRGCYSTICKDSNGNDNGTLNRELFEYVDMRIPGTIYVGDSTSSYLNEIIGNQIIVNSGYCASYIFLFAPNNKEHLKIYRNYYEDLFSKVKYPDSPALCFALENSVDEVEIDRVIDLRNPETQEWIFQHFKNGDSAFLTKMNREDINDFFDILPSLMHPGIGGTGATHGIGTWMRTSRVNGLIYPSARSNTSVIINNGKLVDFEGWNFVDYRSSENIPGKERVLDYDSWHGFIQPNVKLHVAKSNSILSGSWEITGNEENYNEIKNQIEP